MQANSQLHDDGVQTGSGYGAGRCRQVEQAIKMDLGMAHEAQAELADIGRGPFCQVGRCSDKRRGLATSGKQD